MTFLSTEPKFADSDNVLLGKILQELITNGGGGGGGGSGDPQTPWASNINGGGFNLSNVGTITATTFVGSFPGAQTPWTQNINGGGFNLTNVGTIESALFGGDSVLVSNLSGGIEESGIGAGELGFLVGVTSAIQTQLNARVLKAGDTMTGLLQFSGTTHSGIKLNNLTTAQRDAIGSPTNGLILYNTTTDRLNIYAASAWKNGFVRLEGDTMTGLLTVAQATANTAAFASTGYSLTGANAQSLIDLAGTWNTSGAPTAIKLNITNTASGTALLADFQVGGVSQFNVTKSGIVVSAGGYLTTGVGVQSYLSSGGLQINNAGFVGWSSDSSYASTDTKLFRDAANTLALRNGVNAQTFRVYGTFTDASNFNRMTIKHLGGTSGGVLEVSALGTGGVGPMQFAVSLTAAAPTNIFQIASTGHLLWNTDNTYDIGASGATRPRNIWIAGAGTFGGTVLVGAAQYFQFSGRTALSAPADGQLLLFNAAGTDFSRIQLGGTSDSFGAVARDGAGIKFVGGAGGSTAWIKVPGVTVANLPAAGTAGAGAVSFVTDAVSQVFGATVTGGGSVLSPVYSDGTVWRTG